MLYTCILGWHQMLKNSSILYSMYDTCAGTCIYIVPIAKGWNGCVRNLKLPALLRAMFYVFSKKKFLNMYWILQFWSLLNIRIHDSSIFCNVQMILKKTRGKFIKPHRFWCESPITYVVVSNVLVVELLTLTSVKCCYPRFFCL